MRKVLFIAVVGFLLYEISPVILRMLQINTEIQRGLNPEMLEIDDERWWNGSLPVTANLRDARPLHPPCPAWGSPDFDRLLKSKNCSAIISCDDGGEFLFVGWEMPIRQRMAGQDVAYAVPQILDQHGWKYGYRSDSCFSLSRYFHGPDVTGPSSRYPNYPYVEGPPHSLQRGQNEELVLNPAASTAISDAIKARQPWKAVTVPEVRKALQRTFGDNFDYQLAADGVWTASIDNGVAFLTVCKAHDCPDDQTAFTIDLKTGACAGGRITDRLRLFAGDYQSMETEPQALKNWIIKLESEPAVQ